MRRLSLSWKSGQISFVSPVSSSHKGAPDGNSSPRFRYPRSFKYVSDSVISFGRMHVLEGRECPEETDISSCNSALSFLRSLSSSFIAGNIPANFPECSEDMFPFSAVATSFTVPMVLALADFNKSLNILMFSSASYRSSRLRRFLCLMYIIVRHNASTAVSRISPAMAYLFFLTSSFCLSRSCIL